MVTKKELLKDIRSYSPQEIAEAIRAGVVSMYDLTKETEGAFTPLLKRQVKAVLNDTISTPHTDLSQDSGTAIKSVETETEVSDIVEIPTSQANNAQLEIPVFSYMENKEKAAPEIINNNQVKQDLSVESHDEHKMFRKIFSIKGRIRRTEYALTYLVYWLWNLPMNVLTESEFSEVYAVIYLITVIPFIWILIAQGAKRCHDRGNSGWFQIIPFYFLWMIFAEGDSGINEYGKSPK